MTAFLIWRRSSWLALALVSQMGLIAAAQKPDKAPPDPAEARLKSILAAKLDFRAYVFAEEKFPAIAFDSPAKIEELIGPFALVTTFYDRSFQSVQSAKSAGLYGAVVEVRPKSGPPMRRYFTLFRSADKPADDGKFNPEAPADLAKWIGLDPLAMKAEAKLISEQLKARPFSEWAREPRAARLLAGLSQEKPKLSAVRKNVDAFALERQWWVSLKRKLAGLDKVHAKPFIGPRPIDGTAARVVREGTLAEAGMKADAVDKIDAVLKEWAANDDQAFAVCIVRHGVIVLHRAYGERDGKPMTVTTKSWMASITKSMSATLMMMLVDQGLVSLDDPIDKHLPPLHDIKVEKPVTIRHLYTHTNGLHKWPGWNDELSDVEDRVALYYPKLKVGKEFGYNGNGYVLGGKIIENISGEAVPLFFQRHLLDPLDCPNTDVIGTHADAQSVPLDIAKFGQMLLNKGAYGKLRFFREETFQKMLPQPLTAVLGPDAKRTFGIGLDGKPERFGHGAASAATFSVDCQEDMVVIMTRNRMGKNQGKYNGKFWEALKAAIEKTRN